jgi:Polyketide cyclase / dehydrase and lipid transport
VGAVKEWTTVALAPEGALALWTNLNRWATFVDGFGRVVRADSNWPEPGAKLVWQSKPGGRGTVTERVIENSVARFRTQVFEDALSGTQTVSFSEDAAGALVDVELEYQLTRQNPLTPLTDRLFIRRAQQQSLARTLRRFATEAEEEAGL